MPHAIRLSDTAITGYDPSRAQLPDGAPGEGWAWIDPEQYAAARAMARPTLVDGVVIEGPEPPPPPPYVPQSIKAWQAKRILAGIPLPTGGTMLELAEQIIGEMPDGDAKTTVLYAWQHEADFPRDSATIIALAASIPLTDGQLDAMYVAGDALQI